MRDENDQEGIVIKLIIIADDLTGALDSSVHFARKGIRTAVLIDMAQGLEPYAGSDIEVLAVNTASRHDAPEVAAGKIEKIVSEAMELKILYIYKKTDSALRGNIGAELQGVYQAAALRQLPFIPAYPKLNRVTKNGIQYVDGVKLNETAVGKDPFDPVRFSEVVSVIGQKGETPSCSIPYGEDLPQWEGICVYDAETDEQMMQIGRQLSARRMLHVTAGCGGFAEILSALLFEDQSERPKKKVTSERPSLLVACGSITEQAMRQILEAKQRGTMTCRIPERILLQNLEKSGEEETIFAEQAAETLRETHSLVLHTADISEGGAKNGGTGLKEKEAIEKNLGCLVKRILDRGAVDVLCVFGGDTLLGIMKMLESFILYPGKELLPGVVCGSFLYHSKWYKVIAKAGSFGAEDVIWQIEREVGVCTMN